MNSHSLRELYGVNQKDPAFNEIPVVQPADEVPVGTEENAAVEEALVEANERSTFGLVELLLKQPARVDRLNRDEARQPELIPRFLGVGLASYLAFGVLMVLILNFAPAAAWPHSLVIPMPPAHWHDGTFWSLPVGYTVGLVLAICVCLPSFYFFGLLAGIKMSFRQVVGQVMKGTAANAVLLVGILPIYVAVAMGLIVFDAPADVLQWTLKIGLLLPFIAGPWGMRSIYLGVMGLADTLPAKCRHRRTCFLRRLTFAWSACYAAVSPIMIYRLWEYFAEMAKLAA